MAHHPDPASPLARILPGAPFTEWHTGVVEAPIERVWDALHHLCWSDLRVTKPLLLARGFGAGGLMDEGCLETFWRVAAVEEQPPRDTLFALVGKPWTLRGGSRPTASVAEVMAFGEPGWLKYGMEWRLTPLVGDRTFVETSTLCLPTDARAHRRFAAYWALIRVGSGLIRRDMIAALRRLA